MLGAGQADRPPVVLVVLVDWDEGENEPRVVNRLDKAPEAERQHHIASALNNSTAHVSHCRRETATGWL
jgi:hypothetical protein